MRSRARLSTTIASIVVCLSFDLALFLFCAVTVHHIYPATEKELPHVSSFFVFMLAQVYLHMHLVMYLTDSQHFVLRSAEA